MWSVIEIIQFITINLICIFMIYFASINFINITLTKKMKSLYIFLTVLNIIWFILIYILTFAFWKTSWGVITGVNFSFIIFNTIVFVLLLILDKNCKFKLLK
ncbi:hypothetical protein [Spiroplasma floricola]|uniref:Uncharacterized protein n=1 Tax=Spiroplasma floricola 23-6 TaxID=1336749 RepID=A0A2K8SE86_9MOLU|nr:hypothetical protein [Spiroplasma floricola]AUB31655.1 hypothetical protein SFLOR_v1c06030 [Spiroplasma floricola 23-6]